jgi:hypothetical protein
MKTASLPIASWLAAITFTSWLPAQDVAKVSQALPFATKGKVDLVEAAPAVSTGQPSQPVAPTAITAGGKITTGANGSASVTLGGVGTVQMERNTEIQIPADPAAPHSLELLKGKLFLQINAEQLQGRKAGEFRLKTPAALLAVKGTRFFVDSEKKGDTIGLHEGSVMVTEPNTQTTATLVPDQAVTVSPGSISTPRPLNAKEKTGAGTYEDIKIVSTPLLVSCTEETINSRREEKIFWQGRVGPRASSNRGTLGFLLTDLEHVRFGNRYTKPTIGDAMLGDGTVVMKFEYNFKVAKRNLSKDQLAAAFENYHLLATQSLHFKGEVWRAKNAGLPMIGPLVGMQVRLRFKNVSRGWCAISLAYPDQTAVTPLAGSVSFAAPAGLAQGADWETSCVIPFSVNKSGENSSYNMHLSIYPEGPPLDAVGKPRQGTAVVSLSDISLVSRSR